MAPAAAALEILADSGDSRSVLKKKGFAIWNVPEASANCYLKGALTPSQNDCLMLSGSQESG